MTPSPKILHLITELSIGGAQNALYQLLAGLDRERFDILVACFYNGDKTVAQRIRSLEIPVIDLGMKAKWRWDAFWRLYRLMRVYKPSILHTWMFHANIPGRIIARFAQVPVIISSEHTMAQEGYLRERLNRLSASYADRIICVSDKVAEYGRRTIQLPADRIVIIPNGINLSEFDSLPTREQARTRHRLPLKATILGTIGRPRPVKGYPLLLQAFDEISQDFPDSHLLFVGDGPQRDSLIQQAEHLGIKERVRFLTDQDDIPGLLPAIDIYVQSSLSEGLPIAVLEAMAASLPVVATDVGGTAEVVLDRETGLLVPPGEPGSLRRSIADLLTDPNRRQEMGLAGRQRVETLFPITKTISHTTSLYEGLLVEKRTSYDSH